MSQLFADAENFYRTILDTIPTFVFVKNRHFSFEYLNRALADGLGKPPERILGTTDADHFTDETLVAHYRRVDEEVLRLGVSQRIERESFVHATLGRRTLATTKVPLWTSSPASSEPYGILGICTDITGIEQTKNDLDHERDLLMRLMHYVTDGIFFKDAEGHFTRVNLALAKLVGETDPANVIGKTDWDYFHPEYAAAARKEEETLLRTGDPTSAEQRKTVLLGEDPTQVKRWRTVTKALVPDSRGVFSQIIGISRDTTSSVLASIALQNNTEMLEDILNHIPFKIFVKDREGVYIKCNKNFSNVHGYESPDEVIGKTDFDHWDVEQARRMREDDFRAMARNEELHIFETLYPPDSAEPRHLYTRKIPLHDPSGEVQGVLGIYDDVNPALERERDRELVLRDIIAQMRKELDDTRLEYLLLLGLTHGSAIGMNRAILCRFDHSLERLHGRIAIGQKSHADAVNVHPDMKWFKALSINECLTDFDRLKSPPDKELNELVRHWRIDLHKESPLYRQIQNAIQIGRPQVRVVRSTDQQGLGEARHLLDMLEPQGANDWLLGVVSTDGAGTFVVMCDNIRTRIGPVDQDVRLTATFLSDAGPILSAQQKERERQAIKADAEDVAHRLRGELATARKTLGDLKKEIGDKLPSSLLDRLNYGMTDLRYAVRQVERIAKAGSERKLSPFRIHTEEFIQLICEWIPPDDEKCICIKDCEVIHGEVEVDDLECHSVVEEIIRNATRSAIDRAPLELLLRVRADERPVMREDGSTWNHRFLRIEFLDNGTGFAEADLPRVFDRGYSTKQENGAGIGLADVKKTMELHGGFVEAHNRVDRPGAIIVLRFPLILEDY